MAIRFPQPPNGIDPVTREWALQLVQELSAAMNALARSSQSVGEPVQLPIVTVEGLGSLKVVQPGRKVFVTDDPKGPQEACSDGTAWKRTRDGSTVTPNP